MTKNIQIYTLCTSWYVGCQQRIKYVIRIETVKVWALRVVAGYRTTNSKVCNHISEEVEKADIDTLQTASTDSLPVMSSSPPCGARPDLV
jgi:hypothetical protein